MSFKASVDRHPLAVIAVALVCGLLALHTHFLGWAAPVLLLLVALGKHRLWSLAALSLILFALPLIFSTYFTASSLPCTPVYGVGKFSVKQVKLRPSFFGVSYSHGLPLSLPFSI